MLAAQQILGYVPEKRPYGENRQQKGGNGKRPAAPAPGLLILHHSQRGEHYPAGPVGNRTLASGLASG
jgi:hypothetical protein